MGSVLEADSIQHSFGGRAVLSDVYLQCRTGEVLAVIGRNGVGKTTLFRILFGDIKPDNAFIRINDEVVSGRSFKTGLVSYVPQFNFLPANMRVKKVTELFLDRSDEFFNNSFYKKIKNKRVGVLSHGEQKLLGIQLILKNKSQFVILDEPFRALDPLKSAKLVEMIKETAKIKGVILSDHNHAKVSKVATRYVQLRDGCLSPIDSTTDFR